jgi:hypothetical protein
MLMGYLLSEPNREKDNMKIDTGTIDSLDPLPWQRTASRKAVERYADAQERKWRRWNEAMFERKS